MGGRDPVVILNDFSSAQGGAGYLAYSLASDLAARGVPVTFICGDDGHVDWPDGVAAVPLNGAALLDGARTAQAVRGLYNRAAAIKVRDWISRNDTPRTIYHMHNWSNILSPAIFDALAPVAARCVIHAHDFFLACPNGAFLDYPRAQVCTRQPLSAACLSTQCDKRSYAQKVWRSARQKVLFVRLRPHLDRARFVMIHTAMRPWLMRAIKPRHLTVIRNPVTPFGTLVTTPEQQRGIAHIGQIQRLKGVYDLAEAGRRQNVTVDFFGTGEDLDDLRKNYPEHVYHGFTDRATLAVEMGRVRAVVVATQSPEPFCLAAFESRAMGLPLLVSRAILAEDELSASGAALPFDAGDVASLSSALAQVMTNDVLVARLAQSARACVSDQTLSGWVDEHEVLYAQVLHTADRPTPKERALALP